jgi:uncharacterized paraquat-inducible protein A
VFNIKKSGIVITIIGIFLIVLRYWVAEIVFHKDMYDLTMGTDAELQLPFYVAIVGMIIILFGVLVTFKKISLNTKKGKAFSNKVTNPISEAQSDGKIQFCSQCGKQISKTDKFCKKCGNKITIDSSNTINQ